MLVEHLALECLINTILHMPSTLQLVGRAGQRAPLRREEDAPAKVDQIKDDTGPGKHMDMAKMHIISHRGNVHGYQDPGLVD